jgi:hypothetical protein
MGKKTSNNPKTAKPVPKSTPAKAPKRKHEDISETHSVEQIQQLEQSIKSDKQNSNNLVELLKYLDTPKEQELFTEAENALLRLFKHFFAVGEIEILSSTQLRQKEESLGVKQYKKWLYARYKSFREKVLAYEDAEHAIDILMQLTQLEVNSVPVLQDDARELEKCAAITSQETLGALLEHFCFTNASPLDALEHFRDAYVHRFHDVRYFSLEILTSLMKQYSFTESNVTSICRNILTVMHQLPPTFTNNYRFFFTQEEPAQKKKSDKQNSQLLHDNKNYKKSFSKFWLSFLQIGKMPLIVYQLVLKDMDNHIIPQFENPFLLNDFISASFNKGGLVALLSIKSLFTLITKYNM